MVDWRSPVELKADATAFNNFMHALFGLYLWEFITSLDFDWQFLSRKKRFKWPLIFYFAGRYCLLVALIGITVALNAKTEINCQALYTFNQVFGNASIGLASINLSIRTMAVWSQNKYVVGFLILVILVHWSFLLHGVLLKASWVQGACAITYTNNQILAISFIYSMLFDFTVLCLTGWKLAFPPSGRSKLINLIFGDGLIYFLIAFLANLLATVSAMVFMLLDLNAVMSIIANVPAAIASTIVASRVVRRLTNFTSRTAEVYTSTAQSTVAFRTPASSVSPHRISVKKGDSVHIQMNSLVNRPDVEYDAAGRIVQSDEFDPEARVINDEFKKPPY